MSTEDDPGQQLETWLTTLVRNRDYGELAKLRHAGLETPAHIMAGWFDLDQRELFAQVAFLFAVYHRGMSSPSPGTGSLGAAARRIGSSIGRGPNDPGASRLVERVVASRRIPWRHLQHAIVRLRSCEEPPPSWAQLAADLGRWHDRKARVSYRWAVDFYNPSASTADHDTTRTISKGTQ
ncbi:hypothetical protein GCM10027589_12920 [Actinocorallia lasiicapitis]